MGCRMSRFISKPPPHRLESSFGLDASAGRIPGTSVVHKFGRAVVGTTFTPVAFGGFYNVLQPASATTLRVKAGNANDTAAGTGAREITLIGLDETGAEVTETLATAGASASSATSATFIRLYRLYVSVSGTYATQSAGSHAADIVIENGAGGTDWATIDSTDFPKGQSEIGVFSVPLGKTAYIEAFNIQVDSNKPADVILFQRPDILQAAAPYSGMRILVQSIGLTGSFGITSTAPLGPLPALTDVGFMAKVGVGTGILTVDFEIYLEDT